MLKRLQALEHAQAFIGVSEQPPGSNHGKWVDRWQLRTNGVTGYPWCAAFVYCMFLDVGVRVKAQEPSFVGSWEQWADDTNNEVYRPFRGDLVCYSWNGETPDPQDHIGLVERVLALPWPRNGRRYYIRAVEGNTGDAVRRRWRWIDPKTVAFVRVPG